jgi:hypothetical protein
MEVTQWDLKLQILHAICGDTSAGDYCVPSSMFG